MKNNSYICIEVEADRWEAMQELKAMVSPQITAEMIERVIDDLERKEKINLEVSELFRIFDTNGY